MSLISALQAKDKKGLFKSNDEFISYSTGLPPLDFANGFVAPLGQDRNVATIGVMGGTFTTIIGYSGSGKTTLADQIAYNIIKPFEDGLMFHFDIEKTALKARIFQVTGAYNDPRIILKKDDVSIEDVLDTLDAVCEAKGAGGDQFKYVIPESFWPDPKKPVKMYVPTVFVLDSLATFNSKTRKEDELEGQMSAGREAGQISQFYSKCLNKMSRYNVSIISVNHLRAKIDINPYQPSPTQIMLLKPGETMPRGNAPIYLAQNIFRVSATKGNMYTMEDNGFEGFRATIQVAKTKTSFIGSTVNVCFNKDIGFDPIYTMYEFADQCGLVSGRNPYLFIKGFDTFKFNRKDFRSLFIENAEFREGVSKILQPYLEMLLGSKDPNEAEKATYKSLTDLAVQPLTPVQATESDV